MKKRLVILMILMMFTLVGCNKDSEANIPELKITYNNEDILVESGGYRWSSKIGLFNEKAVIADAKSPEQIANDMYGNKVLPEAKLNLEFSKKPKNVKVVSWRKNESKTYSSTKDSMVVPKEEGVYVFEVVGEWKEGTASYTTKVIVE